ncbi:PREDICTED: uncharacterized protein LOC18586490 isoform X3 [Theobroma cacao]|uniref:Uncharacterized protein LOC18586490 isoform X3 n=1 Tax=Theobroma cacao TaxID=3641 RepID=A0AB32ULZ0_THECC|nr:PREDICTED: uncharacterized protein LOC18586490 isoform X3 [Theobroma cacao]
MGQNLEGLNLMMQSNFQQRDGSSFTEDVQPSVPIIQNPREQDWTWQSNSLPNAVPIFIEGPQLGGVSLYQNTLQVPIIQNLGGQDWTWQSNLQPRHAHATNMEPILVVTGGTNSLGADIMEEQSDKKTTDKTDLSQSKSAIRSRGYRAKKQKLEETNKVEIDRLRKLNDGHKKFEEEKNVEIERLRKENDAYKKLEEENKVKIEKLCKEIDAYKKIEEENKVEIERLLEENATYKVSKIARLPEPTDQRVHCTRQLMKNMEEEQRSQLDRIKKAQEEMKDQLAKMIELMMNFSKGKRAVGDLAPVENQSIDNLRNDQPCLPRYASSHAQTSQRVYPQMAPLVGGFPYAYYNFSPSLGPQQVQGQFGLNLGMNFTKSVLVPDVDDLKEQERLKKNSLEIIENDNVKKKNDLLEERLCAVERVDRFGTMDATELCSVPDVNLVEEMKRPRKEINTYQVELGWLRKKREECKGKEYRRRTIKTLESLLVQNSCILIIRENTSSLEAKPKMLTAQCMLKAHNEGVKIPLQNMVVKIEDNALYINSKKPDMN